MLKEFQGKVYLAVGRTDLRRRISVQATQK